MERRINFYPAWDKRNVDGKNYGIHGVTIVFVIIGELGAVEFELYTHWMLPHIRQEQLDQGGSFMYKELYPFTMMQEPSPSIVRYHSPVPMFEGQTRSGETNPIETLKALKAAIDLDLFDKGIELPEEEKRPEEEIPICGYLNIPCYCDSSTLDADKVFQILIAEGDEGLWKALEQRYTNHFVKDEVQ